jgi:hypothetical protein
MWFKNMWSKYDDYCYLGIITFILSGFGAIMWFLHYLQSFRNLPNPQQATPLITSPIDLAAVTATLGGLVLIGAFYRERPTDEQKELTKDLKCIGKLILLSSACFIIAFFGTEYVRSIDTTLNLMQTLYMWATAAAVAIAGLSVSVALSILVTIVKFL